MADRPIPMSGPMVLAILTGRTSRLVEHRARNLGIEVIALGVIAGPGQALSLRLSHISNAGWRKPNPGETWWSLRWEMTF